MTAGSLGRLLDGAPRSRTAAIGAGESTPGVWTFGQLADAVGVEAGRLASKFDPGDRIALVGKNSLAYITALLAVSRAGLTAVPVSQRLPGPMILELLTDAGCVGAYLDAETHDLFGWPHEAMRLPTLGEDVVRVGDEPLRDISSDALILYTSGSTGRPKGVPLSDRGQSWVLSCRAGHIDPATRLLVAAPLSHMNGLVSALSCLKAGATLVLLPEFSAASFLRAIEDHRCTTVTGVPAMFELALRDPMIQTTDVSSVRMVRLGSAPVTDALLRRLAEAFSAAEVTIGYGTTEIGAAVFGRHPDGLPTPAGALGVPLPGVRVRLVGQPDEGIAEIWTPATARGYVNRPAEDVAAFCADGAFRTNDVLRRDQHGFHYFVQRADDMFVCGGENIHPAEVERILLSHPAVCEACVVPVPDPIKGAKPFAFVVLESGRRTALGELQAHCLRHGPAHAHPRWVEIIPSLPLTLAGKPDRRALGSLAATIASASTPPLSSPTRL